MLGHPCFAVFRVFTATSVLRVLLDVEDAVSFAHEPLHPQVLSLVPRWLCYRLCFSCQVPCLGDPLLLAWRWGHGLHCWWHWPRWGVGWGAGLCRSLAVPGSVAGLRLQARRTIQSRAAHTAWALQLAVVLRVPSLHRKSGTKKSQESGSRQSRGGEKPPPLGQALGTHRWPLALEEEEKFVVYSVACLHWRGAWGHSGQLLARAP